MRENSTLQKKPLTTGVPDLKTGNKEKLTKQPLSKNKTENQGLDGAELFSKFTADIIKQQVVFTR